MTVGIRQDRSVTHQDRSARCLADAGTSKSALAGIGRMLALENLKNSCPMIASAGIANTT